MRIMLDEFIDNCVGQCAVKISDIHYETKNIFNQLKRITHELSLWMKWKDRTWFSCNRRHKNEWPVELDIYSTIYNIPHKTVFDLWVPYTTKKGGMIY